MSEAKLRGGASPGGTTAPIGIAAVILAAGAGRRLGGVAKALLPYRGTTNLAAITATARAVGLVDAVVVVGEPFGNDVAAHARQLGLRVRANPAPGRGMASSVAIGFAAVANGPAAAAWLWPVDHPAVTEATLRRLVDAFGAIGDAGSRGVGTPTALPAGRGSSPVGSIGDAEVIQPRYRGQGGHPPLIARALWPRLAACAEQPEGARSVVRAARLVAVDVDDPGVVRDLDTPADLEDRA